MPSADNIPSREAFDAIREKINQHINDDTSVDSPKKVAQTLDRNRAPEWETDWLETYVLFNCYLRKKPARTHGALNTLRTRCTQEGQEDRFDRIASRITRILHPDFITPHGYNRTFSEADSDAILNALGTAFMPLTALGCPIFLYAGALLGYVRNGRLIAHDDDIDIAIFLGECSDEDAPALWLAYKRKLADAGLLTREEAEKDTIAFKIISDLSVEVDVFPAWTSSGYFSVYPYSFGEMAVDDIFPLRSFGQDPLMLPADAEALSRQSYGDGWRVPDPFFHLNWPQKKRIFHLLVAQDYSIELT